MLLAKKKGLISNIQISSNDFIVTINTLLGTGSSIDLRTILVDGYDHDFTINFGDLNFYTYSGTTPSTDSNLNHIYSVDGVYELVFSKNTQPKPKVGGWSVNDGIEKLKLISVDQWGDVDFDYLTFGFYGCSNLNGLGVDGIKSSTITNLNSLFKGCPLANGIPENLFWAIPNLSILDETFLNYSAIELNLPVNLLRYNTNITSLYRAFEGRTFSYIPTDFLRYNILVVTMYRIFAGVKLTNKNLPENLFYYNSNVVNYNGALYNTSNFVLPSVIFNLSNLSIVADFSQFLLTNIEANSAIGTIQDVWNYAISAIHTNAFINQTLITNYASIPNDWKGL